MKRSITIYRTPTDEWWAKTLENLWVTVLEGASNYWVDKINYDMPEGMLFKDDLPSLKSGAHLAENFEVKIYHGSDGWEPDDESEVETVKTFDVMYQGINRLPDELKLVIANDGDWDANDADHIFQLGVFGEVRYG
jgi:hypothetical protein